MGAGTSHRGSQELLLLWASVSGTVLKGRESHSRWLGPGDSGKKAVEGTRKEEGFGHQPESSALGLRLPQQERAEGL